VLSEVSVPVVPSTPGSAETQGREVITGQTYFLANAVVRSVMAKTTEFRPERAPRSRLPDARKHARSDSIRERSF
jgi:hypothetical protein